MLFWKQWTDEDRTTRKTGSGRWKVMSARDDRHLLRMAMKDHTASSRQLATRWSTATGVLMSASSTRRRLLHRGLRAREPLYRIPSWPTIKDRVRNEHRAWQANWHQVVFQMNHASTRGTNLLYRSEKRPKLNHQHYN
ncbi:transposable element Tcb2 transposase [Trichonephila clavipes]|nr:transposable element Tcb2 transposase [Trichonephila clavipes]